MLTLEYPWYSIVEGEDLEQGDFIDEFEVVVPQYTLLKLADETLPANQSSFQVTAKTDVYNLVIVSQSCDLENGKLDYVLMCPRWSYIEYAETNDEFKKLERLEQIRQGKQHRYCMLNKCDLVDPPNEIQIVDLGIVFSIPYNPLKEMAKKLGKRLRLQSPYKEKLAQSFAYYYMRIALPIDIPKFEKTKLLTQTSGYSTSSKQ